MFSTTPLSLQWRVSSKVNMGNCAYNGETTQYLGFQGHAQIGRIEIAGTDARSDCGMAGTAVWWGLLWQLIQEMPNFEPIDTPCVAGHRKAEWTAYRHSIWEALNPISSSASCTKQPKWCLAPESTNDWAFFLNNVSTAKFKAIAEPLHSKSIILLQIDAVGRQAARFFTVVGIQNL